jgi:hypothetical protein
MATFDQLPDEGRAIVELVLRQGKSYAELSELLGLPEDRVRERARDALVQLAPISARGVEPDRRGQLADYVLGQQAGPEATATRGHLRRSEAARAWATSLLDSLEQLYPNGDMPAVPTGGRAAAPLRETGSRAVGLRRLAAAAALALVALVAVLLWPIGLLTGDDGDDGGSAASGERASQGSPISTDVEGSAIVARQDGKNQILVTARGLEPSTASSAYQVWLYNSERDRKSLGATVTDDQGNFQAGAELPADFRDYEFVDLTSVAVSGQGQSQQFETGPSVLRGLLRLRDRPVARGRGQNRVTLLGEIRLLPLPD